MCYAHERQNRIQRECDGAGRSILRALAVSILLGVLLALATGCAGEPGAPGTPGKDGKDGANGISTTIPLHAETRPATAAECPSGGTAIRFTTSSDPGFIPSQAEPVFPADLVVCNGATGPEGTPGSSVETVKLCDDDTSGYPEYAVRVDGKLYAVYYAPPNVGLTYLKPGDYGSTLGNRCHFTVTAEGEVVR